jgi:phage shock protein PspC (stress-responsive transcriptional regulator)
MDQRTDTSELEVNSPTGSTHAASDLGALDDGRLRRSRSHRMLAGVAGGIAKRFDVDVSLIRVAFVVLACAWGVGIVVYLAMWALVPSEPDGASTGDAKSDDASPSWLAFLLLGAVIVFGVLISTSWWGGPKWGGGIGLLWVVLILGLIVVAFRDRAGRRTVARIFAGIALAAVTLAILVSAAFFALVASTGVPLSGGIGDRVIQPTAISQLRPTYRTAIGNMTLDLQLIHFTRATTRVTASVAVGMLTIEVPPGVVVDVDAHAGVGNVVSTPSDLQSFSTPAGGHGAARPQLILTAQVGVGQVRLIREPNF